MHQQVRLQQLGTAARGQGTVAPPAAAGPLTSFKAPVHSLAGHLPQPRQQQQRQQLLRLIRAPCTAQITHHPGSFIHTRAPHAAAPQKIYTPSRVDLLKPKGQIQVGIRAGPAAAQMRQMSQAAEAARHITYTGTWDCFVKTMRHEGVSEKEME